jgi:hypothetical protein
VKVIINLWQSKLKMDNLIDLINMNWLYDVYVSYEKNKQSFFSKFMDDEHVPMMNNEKFVSICGFL